MSFTPGNVTPPLREKEMTEPEPEPEPVQPEVQVSLEAKPLTELKGLARKQGLAATGSKAAIIERIEKAGQQLEDSGQAQ